jgi:glucose-6-phosphate dehydrogenase assembly protein OpcA
VAEIERQLATLRRESALRSSGPDLRTSVMTHMAWVPAEWMGAARKTLSGLAERHPSRTIILVPAPEADDGLDANVSLRCFPLRDGHGHVCSEVIELRLRGNRASVPASIVTPLLISDLPAFLRWRGQPPFGEAEFQQLVDVVDRLVVDSAEWQELPASFGRLAQIFDRVAVSDIAWSRSLLWRRELALLWPGIAEMRELRVEGPYADALLLAGWLQDRLGSAIDLRHDEADALEAVDVDGEGVPRPRGEFGSASDLLSEELDRFGRDAVYEAAVRAIAAGE